MCQICEGSCWMLSTSNWGGDLSFLSRYSIHFQRTSTTLFYCLTVPVESFWSLLWLKSLQKKKEKQTQIWTYAEIPRDSFICGNFFFFFLLVFCVSRNKVSLEEKLSLRDFPTFLSNFTSSFNDSRYYHTCVSVPECFLVAVTVFL